MNNELLELYNNTSKHSSYQILAKPVSDLLGINVQQGISRYEKQRMDFMIKKVKFQDKRTLDIGGNTGYFSFSAIEQGAKSALIIEGNLPHCEFVNKASEILEYPLTAENRYFNFKKEELDIQVDIIFNLNVIHHLGDDFGSNELNLDQAKAQMKETFSSLSDVGNIMIFQMGYNWKGDPNLPLFPNGTKSEMINFVKDATNEIWNIQSIGIAVLDSENNTVYEDLNENNIKRDDSLGEFRNRPIFILHKI